MQALISEKNLISMTARVYHVLVAFTLRHSCCVAKIFNSDLMNNKHVRCNIGRAKINKYWSLAELRSVHNRLEGKPNESLCNANNFHASRKAKPVMG